MPVNPLDQANSAVEQLKPDEVKDLSIFQEGTS